MYWKVAKKNVTWVNLHKIGYCTEDWDTWDSLKSENIADSKLFSIFPTSLCLKIPYENLANSVNKLECNSMPKKDQQVSLLNSYKLTYVDLWGKIHLVENNNIFYLLMTSLECVGLGY